MDYVALKAELDAGHPVSGPYSGDDQLAADQINALDVTRIKAKMTGQEIREAADPTEYAALTDIKKDQWLSYTSGALMDPKVGGIDQQIVVDIFGGGSATVSALSTLRQETISRATELDFGFVIIGDIQNARAL